MMLRTFAIVCSLLAASTRAEAQRWREIGTTSDGNKVYVDPATITRTDSVVSATVRVVYTTPKATPKGPITGSRAVAMFKCRERQVAVRETIIWHDEAKGTVFEKRTPRVPGYGPVFNSNFSGVALRYLCTPPARP